MGDPGRDSVSLLVLHRVALGWVVLCVVSDGLFAQPPSPFSFVCIQCSFGVWALLGAKAGIFIRGLGINFCGLHLVMLASVEKEKDGKASGLYTYSFNRFSV